MSTVSTRVLSRWQAAGLHLTGSLTLAVLAGLLIFGVWYPQPYTAAAGADRLMLLLIGIDLALGPLLTLIVYRHGKKGMAFDIAFIATVQVAALVYGLGVIALSRPVFVVVTEDVTYLTMATSLSDADLSAATEEAYRSRSWTGPVQVAAPPPVSAADRDEVLESGILGKDIDRLPRYFRAMDPAGLTLIAGAAPLARLAELPAAKPIVDAFVAQSGRTIGELRFQALRGRDPEKDATIVYALGQSDPLGVIPVDPWPALEKD